MALPTRAAPGPPADEEVYVMVDRPVRVGSVPLTAGVAATPVVIYGDGWKGG